MSLKDGSVSLKNILITVAPIPNAQPALRPLSGSRSGSTVPPVKFTILYVGDDSGMPEVSCPELPGWEWTKITKKGDITQVILQTAREMDADLIVMSTQGRQGSFSTRCEAAMVNTRHSATAPVRY